MVTIRKTIIALLFVGFITELLFFCWVHLSYASNLPELPNEKAGRIYRMEVNHGFIRYGTEREIRTLRWAENLQPLALVFALSAAILAIRFKQDFDQSKKTVKDDAVSVGEQKSTKADTK